MIKLNFDHNIAGAAGGICKYLTSKMLGTAELNNVTNRAENNYILVPVISCVYYKNMLQRSWLFPGKVRLT